MYKINLRILYIYIRYDRFMNDIDYIHIPEVYQVYHHIFWISNMSLFWGRVGFVTFHVEFVGGVLSPWKC